MELFRKRFVSMGCPCEIGVFADELSGAKEAIAKAEREVHRLDRKYSHFRDDSYITLLQAKARCPRGTEVDGETAALLDYGADQYEISAGLFDITAGRLARLWQRRRFLPSPGELQAALSVTGWLKLSWQDRRLVMPAGMQLELGGLVKEYAADRAALSLKRMGVCAAFVELGGDIHVTGPRPGNRPWNMGIRKPTVQQEQGDRALAGIPVYAGGLSTSGDYERYSVIDGKRYGHIIDPRTGWPVNSFRSVSVHAPSCLLAGSISTMAILSGIESGLEFLRASGFAWLAHTPDGVTHAGTV